MSNKILKKKVKIELNLFTESGIPIPNPEYIYLREEYSRLIGQVPNDNGGDTDFIGGMPVQMEKNCIKQLLLQPSYSMTLKVDGERFLLFLAPNQLLYLIDRSLTFYYFLNDDLSDRLAPLNLKPFLFDGELVTQRDHYEYLIFDALFYENVSYVNYSYTERYSLCNFAVKNVFNGYFNQVSQEMVCSTKTWFGIETISKVKDIYKHIIKETNRNRAVPLKADGIILQPFDTVYVPYGPWNRYKNVQFKWKPSNELTIDFKIKIVSKTEWNLYTKTDQAYNINQPEGKPLPATCIPTEAQMSKYRDGEIVEFKFKEKGNPKGILFVPVRSRNEKEANSLSTIMSTMCVIHNPFTLDLVTPGLKYLENGEKVYFKKYLELFSTSDLILCSVPDFFTKKERNAIKRVYNDFQEQPAETAELEFRIFKTGKTGRTLDKFTFYYLQDFLLKQFKSSYSETIDIIEEKNSRKNKLRSTYNNEIQDILDMNSITNEYKERVSNYVFENEKKMYNNLSFKLELSNEQETTRRVGLRSQFAGKFVNNTIRVKLRHSFYVNNLWRIDLTKVITGYTLESLREKNESFECECEFIGFIETPFDDFIESMDRLFRLIIVNSNYCETCV